MTDLSNQTAETLKRITEMAPEAWAQLVHYMYVDALIGMIAFSLIALLSFAVCLAGYRLVRDGDIDGGPIGVIAFLLGLLFSILACSQVSRVVEPEGATIRDLIEQVAK